VTDKNSKRVPAGYGFDHPRNITLLLSKSINMLPSTIRRAAVQARTPLIKFLGPRSALNEGSGFRKQLSRKNQKRLHVEQESWDIKEGVMDLRNRIQQKRQLERIAVHQALTMDVTLNSGDKDVSPRSICSTWTMQS